jgi:hypothetical protein
MAAWLRVWAGASSCVVAALALVAACNEPLGPPHKKGSDPISGSGEQKGSDPISPPADAELAAPLVDASVAVTIDAGPPAAPRYTVVDALADAKASPLSYIGIGAWPGNFSIKGCIYRNDRVLVVDVYCTYKEQTAFSVVIISPEKGTVRIYAEAENPISTIERSAYFTFYAETYPPLPDLPAPAVKTATFKEVADWEQKSYDARLPLPGFGACSTGMPDCDQDPAWQEAADRFIAEPTDDWSWLIEQLRNRAQHSGKFVGKKVPK